MAEQIVITNYSLPSPQQTKLSSSTDSKRPNVSPIMSHSLSVCVLTTQMRDSEYKKLLFYIYTYLLVIDMLWLLAP